MRPQYGHLNGRWLGDKPLVEDCVIHQGRTKTIFSEDSVMALMVKVSEGILLQLQVPP